MTQPTALDRWLGGSNGTGRRPAQEAQDQAAVVPSVLPKDNEQDNIAPDEGAGSHTSPSELANKKNIHPNVHFLHPQKAHLAGLKRLNSLLLPIPYPDSFYKETVSEPVAQSLTLLAFWRQPCPSSDHEHSADKLIGAIRCRLLNTSPSMPRKDGPMLYLSTLVLLSPYRGLGIASHMLNVMLRTAVNNHAATSVGAHVWEANEQALEWYAKRGFEEVQYDPRYYSKLTPHGAKIMSKDISVLDLI